MRVNVPKKTLADVLSNVERVIPARSSNPGLSLLRIDLEDGRMVLSGSSLDIDVRATVPADVKDQASHAVVAHVLSMVVRSLPADDVELDFSGNELQITSGTFTTKLQLVAATSTPVVSFPSDYPGAVDAAQLAQTLSAARYAAAVADFQAVFRGVKLEIADDRFRAVATDGFRLAYYDLMTPTGLHGDAIVPARSVDELIRVLGDGEAAMALQPGQLSVRHGDYALNLKLMDGAFPDYERVIPKSFPVTITLSASRLSEAVNRVSLMADKTANNRVDLFVKDGTVTITAEGSYGRSQEELKVMQEGKDPEIGVAYNARFLVDALGPLRGDVRLMFSGGSSSPSVVRDLSDDNYLAMVVPLRTS